MLNAIEDPDPLSKALQEVKIKQLIEIAKSLDNDRTCEFN